jgi:hypothetical protein
MLHKCKQNTKTQYIDCSKLEVLKHDLLSMTQLNNPKDQIWSWSTRVRVVKQLSVPDFLAGRSRGLVDKRFGPKNECQALQVTTRSYRSGF